MIFIINKRTLFFIVFALIFILIVSIIGYSLSGDDKNKTEPVISLNQSIQPVERGDDTSNYIAFACNVDWGNEVIPDMLEILRDKDVKITFFVTGRWAKEFPDIFKLIIDEGHEIGSHGYQHLNYGNLSLEKNIEQISKADEIILPYLNNKKLNLFAPPSGSYNQNTLVAAEKLGYTTILWSIDTIDWRSGSTKDIIVDRVISKNDHAGSIVLMHPMPETAKALPILIDKLEEKQMKVGRVSDILK
ncbi:polysaccharide deacetylase family protein [Serpentinicella sp. ANB-PHB4]|uniref:polysaccharide deacetylase family protein n=1 Tax=Serpentinicella sp. ANB-PHB4 TaxID=3074076 RepID=UPI0028599907|nr:polysaccharide deacetylase family protein [Serpentinicella sp. ANB-PHB4]MDR5658213.1 polysaccharide deacetylase family protein [Serpentinicella sp. ANB-PHB4]